MVILKMSFPGFSFDFRRLLNLMGLPFMIKLLCELHTSRDRRRIFLFLMIVIITLSCFRQNMLAFYYISRGRLEQYKLLNRYAHAFYEAVLGRNSVLILAGFSFLSYCLPMIYYALFRCFLHFEQEAAEFERYATSLLEQKFTFIHRLFITFPVENVNAIHRKLIASAIDVSQKFRHSFTQGLRHSDLLRFIDKFAALEKVWLLSLGSILAFMAFICFICADVIYVATGSEITGEFVLVIATIVSYLIPITLSIAFPFLLLSFLAILLFINQVFWIHFCADFRSLHSHLLSTSGYLSVVIYRKLHYGQRVWIRMFTGLSKINRYVVCEIFAVGIGLTLMGHTILVLELLIVPFDWRVRLVLATILTAYSMVCISLALTLLRLRHRLYCLSSLIRHHVVQLSICGEPNFIRLRSLWKGHLNIEILCPHRKWAFRLGALGQITSRNILLKCPAFYTALILFILPVVKQGSILSN